MLSEFRAEADLRGHRINLGWTWVATGERPRLHLVRRRRAYAINFDDGLNVFGLAELFRLADQPWVRIERTLYLVPNANAEGGLRQAETAFFYVGSAAQPFRVDMAYYHGPLDQIRQVRFEEVSRIERSEIVTAPWSRVETMELFITPGGGPEQSAGRIVVSAGHADGETADRFFWQATGEPSTEVEFDLEERRETRLKVLAATPETLRIEGTTLRQGEILQSLLLEEAFDSDSGDWRRSIQLTDQQLEAEQVYYYALFEEDPVSGEFRGDLTWRAMAMATGRYGFAERLYQLLPALYQQYDEPDPAVRDQGQLRRFLQVFGPALDQVRSQAEGLRGRHDTGEVRSDLLPHLARWIGWEPDLTQNEMVQRNDIRFAPEIYQTLGTIPNIRALVNRATGWDCRVREFVHNIFLTNAPESLHLWELWALRNNGAAWSDPTPVTRTEGFDGRPAAVLDSNGDLWLFWHSERSGRREIWLQRPGIDPIPRRAMQGAPDDAPGLTYSDANPTVVADGARLWLFWESDREGAWEIWARTFDGLPGGTPLRLTEHEADDRRPAAVRAADGRLWVFWQSNRRGPTDIWARVFDGSDWGLPARITTAAFRDEMPAAALDGSGRIWLFWSTDLGERRNLRAQIYDGAAWGPLESIADGLQRDESPAAIFWDGQLRLFWHSNRGGRWQIWSSSYDEGEALWSEPLAVTAHPTVDKEPAAVVHGTGELQLFWRSQRRGALYRSRTIDCNDPEMLARLGTFEDRAHYTYDTGLENEDFYERGAVGLYLTPDTTDPEDISSRIARVRDFVEPFRPLPVRFVWLLDAPLFEEIIDTNHLINEEFSDEIS